MRILKPLIGCGLFTFLFFCSCQRDVDGRLPEQPVNDSIYLAKVITLDTTLAPGPDTQWVNEYIYDTRKRLVWIKEFEYSQGVIQWGDTVEYRYLNNDTLPYQYHYVERGSSDTTISYLFYNNGFIVKDSGVNYQSGAAVSAGVVRITPLGGNRYQRLEYGEYPIGSGNFNTFDSVTFTRNYSNGNMISGVDTAWSMGNFSSRRSFQYGYDNKPGIFSHLQLWYLGYYESAISYDAGWGQNNLVNYTYTQTSPSNPPYNESYTINYTYRSDGYPLIGRLVGNPSGENKALFKYTKL